MEASFKKSYASLGADRLVLLWLGVWWIANLVQAGFTELANDEAYYHMFAERLAWGYFDHPPVTALLVWAGERLFGGELGVRFFFTVLQPLYLWILWRLIRPADAGRRDAALFVVVSAATLMLQLYGFIAVPDGPLMFTTALFLLTFKWFSENRRRAWLWMGIAMALMAYSKYHGALVVLFALAANPRQLLRPALYSSGAVALLLLVPHLVWQYEHDWASFAYHLSGRNSVFRPGYVVEFLANMLVVFNPFFVPLYVQAWRKVKPQTPVGRALKLLPVAFIVFFMLSSLRGYVQPQWVIVSCFGLVCVLFAYARRHPRTRRYVMRAGGVTVGLIVLARLVMIFNPLGIRFEVFNNPESYAAIAAEGFDSPYYQSLYEAGKVKALNLGVDFTAADFKSGLAEGLRFFAENEGPYLVHCTEGKDRAGFVSALLECLMGATYDEVVADYMTTYVNYYHLEEGGEQYEAVKNSNIVSILTNITGAAEGTDLTTVDLAAAAEDYMLDAGLTADEVTALKANLAKDYTVETEAPAEETPEEPVPQAQTYTVEAGDCLWNIAYEVYGTGTRWTVIYEANRDTIRDPGMIHIGQVLTIPAA